MIMEFSLSVKEVKRRVVNKWNEMLSTLFFMKWTKCVIIFYDDIFMITLLTFYGGSLIFMINAFHFNFYDKYFSL